MIVMPVDHTGPFDLPHLRAGLFISTSYMVERFTL